MTDVFSADNASVTDWAEAIGSTEPWVIVLTPETAAVTDAGETGTGGATPRSDTETVQVVDSGITYYASNDSARAADAGEAIRATKVKSTDRVRVTDAVGPVSGTWHIVAADRAKVTDAGCWSGPLESADAVRVTDTHEDIAPWTLTDDDQVTMADELPPLHVYAYALVPPGGWLRLPGIRILEAPRRFEPNEVVKPTVTAHVTLVISPALSVTFDEV